MHLKRLELAGFKSFANKTTLEFPAGITAVVGPNGSGKSNVIDAIRWLLGEREAKNMRGLKAEDLIFAGTPQKPRMSLAQATMVFDNQSQFFPVEYEEVSIRRRIGRDGVSEYFLNDAKVRVKDIIDFFAKSRLGTKGFSIINQGDSDLFVRSTPKERRMMLEEILGLREFQLKKHEAELKLKNTNINMEKAHALLEELKPHLRLLRRQTAKWEKQSEIEAELKEIEDAYFSGKLFMLDEDKKAIKPEIENIEKEIQSAEKYVKEKEVALKNVEEKEPSGKEDVKKREAERKELIEKRSRLERELGKLEARLELQTEIPVQNESAKEVMQILEEVRDAVSDLLAMDNIQVMHTVLTELSERLNEVLEIDTETPEIETHTDERLEKEKEAITKAIAELDSALEAIDRERSKIEEHLSGFNTEFKNAFAAVQVEKDKVSALEAKRKDLQFKEERIEMQKQDIAHQAKQMGRSLDDFSAKAPQEGFSMNEAERRILRLQGELASIGEIDKEIVREAKETEERHEFLSSQLEDLTKACDDISSLIKDLDTKIHDGFKDAIHKINSEFSEYFKTMFGGGHAKLSLEKKKIESVEEVSEVDEGTHIDTRHDEDHGGVEISLSIPRKRIHSLDALSGGEKTLVSIAVLFALISVSPPPFLVLDEIDAALDEVNTKRFADLVKDFAKKSQFLIVTHNRATMESADVLYGVTMNEDGTSKVLSLKFEEADTIVA